MDWNFIYTVSSIGVIATIIIIAILEHSYLKGVIKRLTEQNRNLMRENHSLASHNGQLYDENQNLKLTLKAHNIPDYNRW